MSICAQLMNHQWNMFKFSLLFVPTILAHGAFISHRAHTNIIAHTYTSILTTQRTMRLPRLLPLSPWNNKNYCYMTASKVPLSLAETACNSFVQKLILDCACSIVKNLTSGIPKPFLAVSQPRQKVMLTCPQLILVLKIQPKNH